MEKLRETFGKEVEFFIVYIREAHPTDGRQTGSNVRENILVKQPKTFEQRAEIASAMCSKLDIDIPTLIDNLDDKVNQAYNALPDRLYLVGADGKIAFQGDRGPFGFKPSELEGAIKKTLGRRGN